jgi:hypothetical protein
MQEGASTRCALHSVQTHDSLGVITGTLLPDQPHTKAPLEVRQEHLEAQLDTIVGTEVQGGLRLLGGYKNRLHGGVHHLG